MGGLHIPREGAQRYYDGMALRALETLRFIYEGGSAGVTIAELMRWSGRSRATIYRDLELIEAAGWRLERKHDPTDSNRAYYYLAAVR